MSLLGGRSITTWEHGSLREALHSCIGMLLQVPTIHQGFQEQGYFLEVS